MCARGVWNKNIIFNPLLNALQLIFAGVFITLCGFSCSYSHNNLRRGLILIILGGLISIVTLYTGFPIYFGILHFLGVALLIYSAVKRVADNVSPYIWLVLFFVAFLLLRWVNTNYPLDLPHLWIFGLPDKSFYTADYFPIFPWIFIFMFGTWFGKYVKSGRMPSWFYSCKVPLLPVIGRHTLLIYLLHQPLLYLIMYLLKI